MTSFCVTRLCNRFRNSRIPKLIFSVMKLSYFIDFFQDVSKAVFNWIHSISPIKTNSSLILTHDFKFHSFRINYQQTSYYILLNHRSWGVIIKRSSNSHCKKKRKKSLTLIWVGFLGVGFEVSGGEITLCLKLVRLMLEITHICSFRNIPFSTKVALILLMSALFCKKSAFFGKNSTFTQSNGVRAMLEIF